MIEKRIKFRAESELLNIPVTRFRVGIIIGLLYAVIMYSFLYLSREAIRIGFIISEYYDVWVLSDQEVHFYNLFFAFMSMFFGQAACFNFWIHYPKKFNDRDRRYFRKASILNDFFGLNNFHFLFITKMGAMYGIFFGCTFGFYVFSLYVHIKYILIAIIVVLFLNQWKTLRLVYPKKSLKWMGIAVVVISFLSFGLSRVNIVDYKKINESFLTKKVEYNYELNIPFSKYSKQIGHYDYTWDLYFAYPKNKVDTSKLPTIILNKEPIPLHNLSSRLIGIKSEYILGINRGLKLHIDKNIPYKYLKILKAEIYKGGIYRIIFKINNRESEVKSDYHIDQGLFSMLYEPDSEFKQFIKFRDSIKISLYPNYILFNKRNISLKNMHWLIKRRLTRILIIILI